MVRKINKANIFRQGLDKRTKIVKNSYDDVWYHIGQVKWWLEEIEYYFKQSFRHIFPQLVPNFTWNCHTEWVDGEKISLTHEETLRRMGLGGLIRILFGYIRKKDKKRITGYLEASEEFSELIQTVLKYRNWFTHNFQEDEARKFVISTKGREKIICGLTQDMEALYEIKQYFQALMIYISRSKNNEPAPLSNKMYNDMLKNYLPKVPKAFGFEKFLKGTIPILK